MQIIKQQTFGFERALYNTENAKIEECRFEGEEDGESALKESRKLDVSGCFFDLRYPLWHVKNAKVSDCEMTEHCRAALWYDDGIAIDKCKMHGIKALRECRNVSISDTDVVSPEFGWNCGKINVDGTSIEGEYAFMGSRNIKAINMSFKGKYSFQYTKNVEIAMSVLDTKDAFWHSKNVTVRDSVITGEYLGWYSDGLTLINCKIKGTQPLCYCKNLRLVDCTMEDADLSFENSVVNAKIIGNVDSVKNPRSGKIIADSIGKVILSDFVRKPKANIISAADGTKAENVK